jgi:hypothetical protein
MSDQAERAISTSAVAKMLHMPSKELFSMLVDNGWILRGGEGWRLTKKGEFEGGRYTTHEKFGTYITWPSSITNHRIFTEASDNTVLTASGLGNRLGLSARHVNLVFLELGWLNKGIKGWELSARGKEAGGIQMEYPDTGIPYVTWPREIMQHPVVEKTLQIIHSYDEIEESPEPDLFGDDAVQVPNSGAVGYRTLDGHVVETRAESLIANWLYMSEIVYAYRRMLPVEDNYQCGFYLPAIHLYIEIWGDSEDSGTLAAKLAKRQVYQRYGLDLLELSESDAEILDDVLPKRLLKYGLAVY